MRKVAIVRRNGLGDLLLTIPLLCALKNQSECSITLFLEERNAPLIPYLPKLADRYVIFPKKGNKYLRHLKTAFQFRNEKFDLAISAKTSPMKLMNLFLFTLGAKDKVAYVDNDWTSSFINQKVKFSPKIACLHQTLKTLRLLGIETVNDRWYPALKIPSSVKEKYPFPTLRGPILLLSASTTNASNRIHPKKYVKLVNRLHSDFNFSILLLGEKKDENRVIQISEGLNMAHKRHIPENFDEFMVWQSYCDLYFVPDGGTAHIGAGLQKHQVILFGNSSPKLWAPLSKKALCLFHKEHVDYIDEEEIYNALYQKFIEVEDERVHL